MIRRVQHLVRIRGNRDRQLVLSGSILTMICVALLINLTIMLTKRSSNQNKKSVKNDTNETTRYILNTTEKSFTQSVLSTTVTYRAEKFLNHTLPDPLIYQNYGRPLDNFLYFSYPLLCRVDGFVVSVQLRLFSEWKGHAPLYLFVISAHMTPFNISIRYAVNPQRNTTEWQTINIPSGALPIQLSHLFGIGMQENSGSTNEIYAIQGSYSYAVIGVNENTTIFNGTLSDDFSAAFSYTVVYND